jgi:hypothetical protein
MSSKHTDADPKLPNRLRRLYNTVTNIKLPRPLWIAYLVRKLDNYIEHVCEIGYEPDKRTVANKPGKPSQPDKCGIFTCGSDDEYCYCLTNIKCDKCFDTGYDYSGFQCECTDNKYNDK